MKLIKTTSESAPEFGQPITDDWGDLKSDFKLMLRGVWRSIKKHDGTWHLLDPMSFLQGLMPSRNPVYYAAWNGDGSLKYLRFTHNLRTNLGSDLQSRQMGGNTGLGVTGTSSGVTATTMTDSGKAWTTNQWAGFVVFTGAVYGVVLSNTGTVLTIDKWYTPATPGGTAATTPGTGTYVLGLAQQPAMWIALTTDAAAPAAGDTTLASEISTNGLARVLGTYGHSASTSLYTITNTFTSTGVFNGIQKAGLFNAANGGVMLFENTFSSVNMVSSDTLQIIWTINI